MPGGTNTRATFTRRHGRPGPGTASWTVAGRPPVGPYPHFRPHHSTHGKENHSMTGTAFDRDVRQRGLVPPGRLMACHAVVIGVGAVGRQVALQLAAVGVPRLTLYDDDRVGVENLAPQGYWAEDLGRLKVDATARACA